MTTKKRYEEDAYLKDLDTTLVQIESGQTQPALILEETLFFPEGGGQPWDLGTINGVALAGVVEKDGTIYHLLASPQDAALFTPGQPVHCSLDWPRRFDHMQRHCGEHILSGIFFQAYGGVNRGFHMGEDYMTIDIHLEADPNVKEITWEMALHAEDLANRAIWQNLPVTVRRFSSMEEAAGIPLRKELVVEEDISIVCVGDENNPCDCVACCGTHPSTSGQVGIIKIFKAEHYKGMYRIYFEAGRRAVLDYRFKHELLTKLGIRYSAGAEDLLDKIETREKKNADIRNQFYRLRQSVIRTRVEEIQAAGQESSQPMLVRTYGDLPQDDLLTIGRTAVEKLDGLLVLHDPTDYTLFLFSRGIPDCGKLVRNHVEIYNAKGGGNTTSARILFSKPDYPILFIDLLEKHLR